MGWWKNVTKPVNDVLDSNAFKAVFPVQAIGQEAVKYGTKAMHVNAGNGLTSADQYAIGAGTGSALAGGSAAFGGGGAGSSGSGGAGATTGAGSPGASAPASSWESHASPWRMAGSGGSNDQQQAPPPQQNQVPLPPPPWMPESISARSKSFWRK